MRELLDEFVELQLSRAFAEVEARAGEVGWEQAVGEYRDGHRAGAELVDGQWEAGFTEGRRWATERARRYGADALLAGVDGGSSVG